MKEINNRKYPRLSLAVPLRYKIRGQTQFGSSVTRDISTGGVRFTSESYIKPATDISLEIGILSKVINSIGKVKWSQSLPHSNRYQIGLEFIELETLNKNFLSDYINFQREFKER